MLISYHVTLVDTLARLCYLDFVSESRLAQEPSHPGKEKHMRRAPRALLCVHCGEQLIADGDDRAAIDDLLNYRAPRHMRIYHGKEYSDDKA